MEEGRGHRERRAVLLRPYTLDIQPLPRQRSTLAELEHAPLWEMGPVTTRRARPKEGGHNA